MSFERGISLRSDAFLVGFIGALVVSLSAGCAVAQGTAAFDPFRIPSRGATCEVVAPSLGDPVPSHRVFSFAEGEELRDQRLIEVGYDSLGVPLWATVQADEFVGVGTSDGTSARGWRVIPHAYSIRFDHGPFGEGLHVPGLVMPDSGGLIAGHGRPMSAEQLKKARRLLEALWLHGCGGILGGA